MAWLQEDIISGQTKKTDLNRDIDASLKLLLTDLALTAVLDAEDALKLV
jgi:hypothetical protein